MGKIFCIGMNKTGTTSLSEEFKRLGYSVASQITGERLFPECMGEGTDEFWEYCKIHQFFQDIPFSIPKFYRVMDEKYSGSKFILTVRDSSEQWYESLIRFHTKLPHIGPKGTQPTTKDMKDSKYIIPGWLYDVHKTLFDIEDNDPYNRDILIRTYEEHIVDVIEYFKDRESDLLVLNLGEEGSYQKFLKFIGKDSAYDKFPHKNSSR